MTPNVEGGFYSGTDQNAYFSGLVFGWAEARGVKLSVITSGDYWFICPGDPSPATVVRSEKISRELDTYRAVSVAVYAQLEAMEFWNKVVTFGDVDPDDELWREIVP